MARSCCEINIEMSSSIEFYKELLGSLDTNVWGAIIAILAILLTTVLWRLISNRAAKKTGILLLGIPGAGKTNLFTQLVCGEVRETLTSLKENEANYEVEGKKGKATFKLLDLPGHEAIRYQYLEKFKANIRAIIFAIDSETFQKNIQDVAEFLFRIFTDMSILKSAPSVCIACNKQDLLLSKSKKAIQSSLEKELNTVRKTQSAALTSTSGGGDNAAYLGSKGKEFQFDQLGKIKVEFVECCTKSVEGDEMDIDEVTSWLSNLMS